MSTPATTEPARRVRWLLCALVAPALALAGSLSASPAAHAEQPGTGVTSAKPMSDAERALKALRVARRQLGDPYKYGAEGPDRFDCSGLVYFATRRAGFADVPRTSAEQAEHMRTIRRSKLRRGDYVFFEKKGTVYHVGVYVGRRDGERTIVHAPSTGEDVSRGPVWTDTWFAATLRGV